MTFIVQQWFSAIHPRIEVFDDLISQFEFFSTVPLRCFHIYIAFLVLLRYTVFRRINCNLL